MIQTAVLILVFVFGSIFAFGLITSWLSGASPAWKTLRERYPEQPQGEFSERRSAVVYLCLTSEAERIFSGRRGCLSFFTFYFLVGFFKRNRKSQGVRLAVDDYSLHMDLDSGAGGPKAPLSLPWGVIEIGQDVATHEGPHTVLTIDEFTLFVPTTAIERELLMRQALHESADDNPFEDGPGEGAF